MKRALRRIHSGGALWHDDPASSGTIDGPHARMLGDCSGLRGNCTLLWGDCSGLKGDCSGVSGDCTTAKGNLDSCDLTDEERAFGVSIDDLMPGAGGNANE